jgi:hypothetical protein
MSRIPDIHLALRRTGDGEDLDLRFIQLTPSDVERMLVCHVRCQDHIVVVLILDDGMLQLSHRKNITQLWLHGCRLRDIGELCAPIYLNHSVSHHCRDEATYRIHAPCATAHSPLTQ